MSVSYLFGNAISKKKRVTAAFAVLLVFSATYLFTPHLFSGINYSENSWINTIISVAVSFSFKFLMFVLCALFVKKVLKKDIGLKRKNFLKGLFFYGSIMLIYSVFNFFFSFPFAHQGDAVDYDRAYKLIPIYLVQCIGIGIGEEGVWRVLGVNLFSWAFGEGKKNGFFAVLIPSLVFGLAHLNNMIIPPVLINATIAQVFYATMIGLLFAVCYYKTGNVLPPIILHALFDFAYYVCRGFYPREVLTEVVRTDITPLAAVFNVAIHLPILVLAILLFFFTLKPETIKPATETEDDAEI